MHKPQVKNTISGGLLIDGFKTVNFFLPVFFNKGFPVLNQIAAFPLVTGNTGQMDIVQVKPGGHIPPGDVMADI
jgi:hypothetical protein